MGSTVVIIAGICITYAACGGAAVAQQPAGYTVAGKLFGQQERAFEAALAVALYSPAAVFQVMSDKTGAFEFKNVPAGHYQLQAMGRGTWTIQEVDVSESTPPLEITVCFALTSCGLPMDTLPSYQVIPNSQQAKLTVLIGLKGKRLNQVDVKVVHSVTHAESIAQPDRQGNFNFESLPPGRYTLTVAGKRFSPTTIPDVWAVAGHVGTVKPLMLLLGAMCQ